MAIRLPFSGLCMNTPATVVSSSRPKQRTMPALRKRASTARSELAMAPVWDDAARLPASEAPALMAAILQPFRMREEACSRSASGSLMFST